MTDLITDLMTYSLTDPMIDLKTSPINNPMTVKIRILEHASLFNHINMWEPI